MAPFIKPDSFFNAPVSLSDTSSGVPPGLKHLFRVQLCAWHTEVL